MQDEVARAVADCMAMVNASALTMTQHVLATRSAAQGQGVLKQLAVHITAALHAAGIDGPDTVQGAVSVHAQVCMDCTRNATPQAALVEGGPSAHDAAVHHIHALLSTWATAYKGLQDGQAAREAALAEAQSRVQQLERHVAQVCILMAS